MTPLDPNNPEHVDLMLRLPFAVRSQIPDFVQDELRIRMERSVPGSLRPGCGTLLESNSEIQIARASEIRDRYREEVREMRAQGFSHQRIADAIGRSSTMVRRILKENGDTPPRSAGQIAQAERRREERDQITDEVLRLHALGWTQRAIAAAVGRSTGPVRRILQKGD